MVVQVKVSTQQGPKALEGSLHKANILLLGAENVGKSALTVRFLTRKFIGEYGDIESIYSHTDKIDGQEISFNVWDSLYPQEGESSECVFEKQLQWADGVVLVYSICERSSFQVATQQLQRLRRSSKMAATIPVVVVGNKRDLQHRRTVSSEEGRLLALAQDCGFFEISAAEAYQDVLLVFHRLVHLIGEWRALRRGAAGFRSIVRSMSAVFGKKRVD